MAYNINDDEDFKKIIMDNKENVSTMGVFECAISGYNEYKEKQENETYIKRAHEILKKVLSKEYCYNVKNTQDFFENLKVYDKAHYETYSDNVWFYFNKDNEMFRVLVNFEESSHCADSYSYKPWEDRYINTYTYKIDLVHIKKKDFKGDFGPKNIEVYSKTYNGYVDASIVNKENNNNF